MPSSHQDNAKNRKQKPADSLLKTSKKKEIELTEQELGKVSGGRLVAVKAISWSHDDES